MGNGEALLRLKAAIDTTLDEVEVDSTSAAALSKAYETFRSEVSVAVFAEGLSDEFDRLFPPGSVAPAPSSSSGFDPRRAAGQANEAAAGLAGISGWIQGNIRALQARAEAEAYAEARLRQEQRP
jgi:hypothetical protein